MCARLSAYPRFRKTAFDFKKNPAAKNRHQPREGRKSSHPACLIPSAERRVAFF
jgi:chromatin segregation and condensation protein Rec8/ScpA/Scc1 (kleisin family)